MQLMFEFENFMLREIRIHDDEGMEGILCGVNVMFSKACQQYFKLSRRLKIQLSSEENFKLTFLSWQINVFVLSDFPS